MKLNAILLMFFSPTAWQWLDFLVVAGLFLLVAIATLVWFFCFRKRRHRRRKKLDEHRPIKPTLAQTGGLPPIRRPDRTFGETPPPMP
jgi:hypothetical protein